MTEVTLSNPLTIEERLQIPRLIEHDSITYFAILLNMPIRSTEFDKEKYEAIIQHLGSVEQTIDFLTQSPDINFEDVYSACRLDKRTITDLLSRVDKILHKGRLEASVGDIDTFLSYKHLMHTVLFNFIKNSLNAQLGTNDGDEDLKVNVAYSKFPENSVFIPDGARDYTNFVVFNFHNKGRGFPKDIPLKEYFTRTVPERGASGFGLYFTKLAAKVLRAPINIVSEPGDTTVSFYHPVYVGLKPKV